MAEEEHYRSGTAKYTHSAINQKALLMYTTNRPERCTLLHYRRAPTFGIRIPWLLPGSHVNVERETWMSAAFDEVWAVPELFCDRRVHCELYAREQRDPIVLLVVDSHAHQFLDVRDVSFRRTVCILVARGG